MQMSRISLKTDIEQRQYENMSDVLERKSAVSGNANAGDTAGRKVRAPPDVFISFDTWLAVLERKSGRS
jgi:hypothetical protein